MGAVRCIIFVQVHTYNVHACVSVQTPNIISECWASKRKKTKSVGKWYSCNGYEI